MRAAGRALALLGLTLALGCRRAPVEEAPFRLGFFPNITHGQALVGTMEGRFQEALGTVPLSTKVFNAGPAVMEALLAGEIEMTYVGPTPAIIAYVRSGHELKVVAGAASGGAVLVVRDAQSAFDLKGQQLASPQVGNTQDVALRYWLKTQGLDASDRPGRDVTVRPVANADTLSLFRRGDIAGAWVPEPWGARLVHEAGGKILVDERSLWPDGQFPATVLVATRRALQLRRPQVLAILRAHVELTQRARRQPEQFHAKVNDAFQEHTGQRLPEPVLEDAFSRLEFTTDPMEPQLIEIGRRTMELGYLPRANLEGLVDTSLLAELDQVQKVGAGGSGPSP